MKLIVPVKGLEPPLPCEKRILNPSRLPIPPHRQMSLLLLVSKVNLQNVNSLANSSARINWEKTSRCCNQTYEICRKS